MKASGSSHSAFMLPTFRINPLTFTTPCDIDNVLILTLKIEEISKVYY